MAYAVVLLVDLLIRSQDLVAHYTDFGVAPRAMVLQLGWEPAYWSLHMMNGTWPFQAALFVVAAVAAAALGVGYRTRISGVVSWLLLISLQTRNPMILDGGDVYFRCVFFWCLFLPWGARWSLDSLRRPGPAIRSYVGSAAIAYRLQLSLIYWMAAGLKTGPEWRTQGSAVYYALMLEQLTTPAAGWLLAHPGLMRILNFATLAFEAVGPVLFWLSGPFRLLAVIGFVGMHLGFACCMHLGVFALVGYSSTLGLLPGEVWDRLERAAWWRRGSQWAARMVRRWPWRGAGRNPVGPPGLWTEATVISLCVYVMGWNLTTIPGLHLPFRFPETVGRMLRIDQRWNMFAPRPLVEDGWYVIEAEEIDGTTVDLFRNGAPVRWNKPADVAAMYPNARWRKYMMNLWSAEHAPWRLGYGQYLTRRWNSTHVGDQRISGFRIHFMLEETLPDGKTAPVRRVTIWQHRCFDEPPAPARGTGAHRSDAGG